MATQATGDDVLRTVVLDASHPALDVRRMRLAVRDAVKPNASADAVRSTAFNVRAWAHVFFWMCWLFARLFSSPLRVRCWICRRAMRE